MINQNIGRGLLLALVALFFLLQAPNYVIGTFNRPGPGLFPVMVATTLLLISVVIMLRAFVVAPVALDFRFRNVALIAGSMISFTLVSTFVNMLAGIAVMTTIACYSSEDFSIPRTGVIIVALCAIAWAMQTFLGVVLPLY
jgi:putative tricarboxylic transport membrane protein